MVQSPRPRYRLSPRCDACTPSRRLSDAAERDEARDRVGGRSRFSLSSSSGVSCVSVHSYQHHSARQVRTCSKSIRAHTAGVQVKRTMDFYTFNYPSIGGGRGRSGTARRSHMAHQQFAFGFQFIHCMRHMGTCYLQATYWHMLPHDNGVWLHMVLAPRFSHGTPQHQPLPLTLTLRLPEGVVGRLCRCWRVRVVRMTPVGSQAESGFRRVKAQARK